MQDEVMENYYNDPKCGEPNFEKGWEQELISLLEQIKNGFVVSNNTVIDSLVSTVHL